jgi:hypothetical protein
MLPNPVFEEDTIFSRSEVFEKRESRSRHGVGTVVVRTTGCDQDGKMVIAFQRSVMIYKEELPREHKSRLWAFAFGAVAYAALLLAL